jgi:hypothetical protein
MQNNQRRFIDMTMKACIRVKNDRTMSSIFNHMIGETKELAEEITKYIANEEPGEDGIVGESIDVILCAMDLIYQQNPSISNDYLYELIAKKIDKWELKYSDKPVVVSDNDA